MGILTSISTSEGGGLLFWVTSEIGRVTLECQRRSANPPPSPTPQPFGLSSNLEIPPGVRARTQDFEGLARPSKVLALCAAGNSQSVDLKVLTENSETHRPFYCGKKLDQNCRSFLFTSMDRSDLFAFAKARKGLRRPHPHSIISQKQPPPWPCQKFTSLLCQRKTVPAST